MEKDNILLMKGEKMGNNSYNEMTWKDIIKMFKKANDVHDWGEYANIKFYDDGTGVAETNDCDVIFRFDSLEDLVHKLKE
jgi:hypothetical protein